MHEQSAVEVARTTREAMLAGLMPVDEALQCVPPGETAPERLRERAACVIEDFATRFRRGVALEHDVLFRAIDDLAPSANSTLDPLRAEHAALSLMIDSIASLFGAAASARSDEQLAVEIHDLTELLRVHIRKEDAAVYRVAERFLSPEAVKAVESWVRKYAADTTSPGHTGRAP